MIILYLFSNDRRSSRSFGNRNVTRDQKINFGNLEIIEKDDHQEVCIMKENFINIANEPSIILRLQPRRIDHFKMNGVMADYSPFTLK
uniref:Uncharacterized protein n=1 Tax=Romanomermis culicivorax TaxID=13658 RepID=A0A915JM67_ROMCU